MGKQKFKFFAQRAPFMKRGISIWGGYRELGENNQEIVFRSVMIEQLPEGSAVEPFMHLDDASAQNLFDELYMLGLRPSREEQIADRRESAHIQDLRKITFKLLEIEGDTK